MNKLILVRHGETDWNKNKLAQGSVNTELNAMGIKQANILKSDINIDKIDFVYASPMNRAKDAALIIVDGKKEIIYDELLVERNFGDFEGKSVPFEIMSNYWNYSLNDSSKNVESLKDLLDRGKKFVEKINLLYDDKTILVVSHACLIKAIHYYVNEYNEKTDFLDFVPSNCVLNEYEL